LRLRPQTQHLRPLAAPDGAWINTITFFTDFERHCIETLRKNAAAEKAT
jgi:hypothetical protein